MPHRIARPPYRPSVGWHITVAATLSIGVYAVFLSLFLLRLGQISEPRLLDTPPPLATQHR
jgi:hypothetical protein